VWLDYKLPHAAAMRACIEVVCCSDSSMLSLSRTRDCTLLVLVKLTMLL
jgi:hypothetical protein